jgi:hypothetical protein
MREEVGALHGHPPSEELLQNVPARCRTTLGGGIRDGAAPLLDRVGFWFHEDRVTRRRTYPVDIR